MPGSKMQKKKSRNYENICPFIFKSNIFFGNRIFCLSFLLSTQTNQAKKKKKDHNLHNLKLSFRIIFLK